jgi:hypothetical protein
MPAHALTELCDAVVGTAAAFDAQTLDREGAAAAMENWATIVHAGEAAMALAAARVAECGPPPSAGASSAADFIAKRTGVTSAKASTQIKTGEGLRANERTRVQATTGKLSADQSAAITDALAVAPASEDMLLAAAERDSLRELRDHCARAKAAHQDLAAVEQRIHANRRVRRWTDPEGAEHLHAVGTKASMSRLDSALRRRTDEHFKTARENGVREPLEAYTYDALVSLADGDSRADDAKPCIRYLGVLRVDWSALVRGAIEDGETCEIAGLGPISVETARALLGESILKLVVTRGVDVVNVTHLGRGPNTAQKIALLWQQAVCAREGCGRMVRLEYDHKAGFEFAVTQHTRLDETDPLCDPDHDLKTRFGWALVDGTGTRPMVPPDDPRHPRFTQDRRPP